ncbi:hypothetical protein [Streptomyces sp. CBMA29]|uniref:hypothetical protein n=1 Tax=Streptomyces sp. CBMA29 TaxID=1896314 RepID=UPI0016621426|nr:hypothetical protein [Streptomyces sp. CBMA29]MBD0737469.1 hypothetical protein [Streptomyces sp. CBMA29]
MTRSAPSGADAALIAALADLGLTVSQAQLERWRAAHYLPPHPREHLGRGRGTASHLLPQTVARAAWLAAVSRQGRALPVAGAWACWAADGSPGGVARLRTAVVDQLDRYGKRLAAGNTDDDDSWQRRHNAAEAAARRVPGLDQHAPLRAIATTAARDPAAVAPLPRVDRGLALVLGRLLAGGGEDVGEDELLEALCLVFPEQARGLRTAAAARDAAGHGGTWKGFPLAGGWPVLQDAVQAAPDQALARAVELVTATAAALELVLVRLGPAAQAGLPAPPTGLDVEAVPDAMTTALADPMWDEWGRHMPLHGDSPAWPTVAAFQTALTLLLPGRADALAGYRERTEQLIRPSSRIPSRPHVVLGTPRHQRRSR